MTTGFEVHGSGVRSVAGSMRDNADIAALAGTALAGFDQLLIAPDVGDRLLDVLARFSGEWCDVIDDLVSSMTQLAAWMDQAVTAYFSVDTDVAYRMGYLHP